MQDVNRFFELTDSNGTTNYFLEKTCKSGLTPLLLAAAKGHYSIVELLVNKKANVKAVDANGDTAVHVLALTLDTISDVPVKRDCPDIFRVGFNTRMDYHQTDRTNSISMFKMLSLLSGLHK